MNIDEQSDTHSQLHILIFFYHLFNTSKRIKICWATKHSNSFHMSINPAFCFFHPFFPPSLPSGKANLGKWYITSFWRKFFPFLQKVRNGPVLDGKAGVAYGIKKIPSRIKSSSSDGFCPAQAERKHISSWLPVSSGSCTANTVCHCLKKVAAISNPLSCSQSCIVGMNTKTVWVRCGLTHCLTRPDFFYPPFFIFFSY